VGPGRALPLGQLRRFTPVGWAPADYTELLQLASEPWYMGGPDAFTPFAELYCVFLVRTRRLPSGGARWGQFTALWWAWAYAKCAAAQHAWEEAVGPLWAPPERVGEAVSLAPPLPGIAADVIGLHTPASRAAWRFLQSLGPLDPADPLRGPVDVFYEFATDWDRGHDLNAWATVAAPAPLGVQRHPQARRGRCVECRKPWLRCPCVRPLPTQHLLRFAARGVDSEGGWQCERCGLAGPAQALNGAFESLCPGRDADTESVLPGWALFFAAPSVVRAARDPEWEVVGMEAGDGGLALAPPVPRG